MELLELYAEVSVALFVPTDALDHPDGIALVLCVKTIDVTELAVRESLVAQFEEK